MTLHVVHDEEEHFEEGPFLGASPMRLIQRRSTNWGDLYANFARAAPRTSLLFQFVSRTLLRMVH